MNNWKPSVGSALMVLAYRLTYPKWEAMDFILPSLMAFGMTYLWCLAVDRYFARRRHS